MHIKTKTLVLPENVNWQFQQNAYTHLKTDYFCHQYYELSYISNGKGVIHLGQHSEIVADKLLFLSPPGVAQAINLTSCRNSERLEVNKLLISSEFAKKLQAFSPEFAVLTKLFSGNLAGMLFVLDENDWCVSQFETMQRQCNGKSILCLLEILLELSQKQYKKLMAKDLDGSKKRGQCPLESTIHYIINNFEKPLRSDELAKMAHMSTNHFHRKFKQKTDLTLVQMLNELRLERACNLLITSRLPIAVVSEQCGFSNVPYFNRRFLEKKGCQPRQFRIANTH